MKKKALKLRLPYFFGQRIQRADSSGTMPELIKPESGWETAESAIEDILRWADDGGKMLDLGNQTTRSNPDAGTGNQMMHDRGKGSATEGFLKP